MPDQPENTEPAADGAPAAEASQPKSLEELLAGIDPEVSSIVLEQVTKARNEAKGLRDRVKVAEPLAAEYNKTVQAQKTAEERAADAAAQAEAKTKAFRGRLVAAEVKALASADFADPADVSAFLNVDDYVDDDGNVDDGAIKSELKKLLTAKPYLAKEPGTRAPRPDRTQASGAQGTAANTPAADFANFIQAQISNQSR